MSNNSQTELAREADQIIEEAKRGCRDRGEIEPGVKRGRMHIWLEGGDVCACPEKIDLSKYRMK